MEIARHILVGDSISYAKDEIISSIEKGKMPKKKNWYGITTTHEKENLLYIMSGLEYRHSMYHDDRRAPLRLIAIAGTRKEAFSLVQEIVQQFVDSEKLFDMKESLKEW